MTAVVLDTSVLIEELRRGSKKLKRLKERSQNQKFGLLIPSIVIMELWGGQSTRDIKAVEEIEVLISQGEIRVFDGQTARLAGQLVRDHGLLPMDAAIAATAMIEGADLVTENKRDFIKVPGLRLWEE